uniref:Reverse transcriptase domain-containing protein n=1 Tax=Tanacetum cinerariifolium TaxID=118510 RepID=A0A6L2KMI3_TANCI|nr:hypothetical protein [Tanacetum cinerariifolium]
MAGLVTKEYISTTSKSFVSYDINGKMIKKNFIEIEGTFLLKVHNNTFFENDGEDVFKHINSFLEVVELLKIKGLSHDRFRLSVFSISLSGAASEWFTKECIGTISTWDDLVERFVLKFYNLCDHEETEDNNDPDVINNVPENFKINDDLFKFDSPLDETLALKAIIEGSWGDANPGVIKFRRWLKSCFENFHELKNEVLVKLEECWWKVNTHEIAPFTLTENFGRGPYVNIKTEWAKNPYLDVNHIFGRDYEASNISCTQENHEHKGNLIPEPLNYRVRRFKMMKYSFTNNEEYITVKVSECLKHLKDSLDAYQELLRLINEGWVVTTPED